MEILKPPAPGVQVVKLSIQEYRVLFKATATRTLTEAERGHLEVLLETFAGQQLAMQADYQGDSEELQKYQKVMFGPKSEKTSVVLGKGQDKKPSEQDGKAAADTPSTAAPAADAPKKKPRKKVEKGHGRNGVAAYTGARREKVPLETIKTGDPCPNPEEDCHGSLYRYFEPRSVLRLEGVAPLSAVIYELEQFRCHECGFLVCAPLPPAAGLEKYRASAVANLVMFRYCVCVPGSRLAMMQDGYGVPVPASSQWDVIKRKTPVARAVHEAMMTAAAQMPFFFNDDTGARILEGMTRAERAKILGPGADPKRTGIHATGIVAKCEDREIALYFTGPLYAAENLARLLERRKAGLPPPVLTCDGLIHRNLPKGLQIILGQCNVHNRRNFVRLAGSFPDEAAFALKTIAAVYAVDAAAKEHHLSDEGRLMLHQNESRPHMEALKTWMDEQIENKITEPNSGLGRAIRYTQKRWSELCLFLEVPGAALDSNVVEQILRRVAHYRNGSLYYRTIEGAKVADCWMSVIRTAEKAGVNVFDYLVSLLEHEKEVMANPKAWLPWTYLETLAELEAAAAETCARAA